MDPELVVETPVAGATALLVEMKDSYDSPISDPVKSIEAIKRVTLISKQLYVGPEDGSTNPGYLFNIETTLNKFFIITKGSIRRASAQPFYMMYEEFSPSNSQPIDNAYERMGNGEQFPVDHNCSSIISQRHDIVMSALDNPKEYAVNLMFYLPDMRFYGETRYQENDLHEYEHYTFYSRDHLPFFFFNKINALIDGPVELDSETHTAEVPLSWVSTYKDITRSKVPERFLVYRVVDDVVEKDPVPTGRITVRQADTQLLDDGSLVRSEDNTVRIYVKEDQYETSRRVTYVVLGRRHHSEFSFVESNTVSAAIPGYTNYETLQIVIDGHARSAYDIGAQINRYENTIDLTDTAGASGDRLLNGHIRVKDADTPGTIFELRRYASAESDDYVSVATMEVTAQEPDKTWTSANGPEGVHVYNGTITYPDGSTATCRFKSLMDRVNPANDPGMPILAVDGMDGVIARFIDKFEVSTAKGDHPRNYYYRIVYQAAHDIVPGHSGMTAFSNAISVSIPVREFIAGYIPYSIDQILAERDAATRLPANPVGVAVTTAQNTSIVGYDITNVSTGRLVAQSLRSPPGIFQTRVLTASGEWDPNLNPATGSAFSGKLPIRLADTASPGDIFALTIVYANGNTYGNRFVSLTEIPEPTITGITLTCYDTSATGSYTYWGEMRWTSGDLEVTPYPAFPDKTESYNVFDHIVWSRNDADGEQEYDVTSAPGANDLTQDASEKVQYNFDSVRGATAEQPVTVDHIVRLYARAPQNLLIAPAGVTACYVISETAAHTSVATTSAVTSVDDIATDTVAAPSRLFDLNGRQVTSSHPAPGIYIKVTGDRVEKVEIR